MDIVILLLIVIGIISVSVSWAKSEMRCSPPKIVYRYIPKHTLDVQFGNENVPSEIYKDMFLKSSPWIGGFGLGNKTFVIDQSTKTK
jgi:hypothetical protein